MLVSVTGRERTLAFWWCPLASAPPLSAKSGADLTTTSPSSSGVCEGITSSDALNANKPQLTQVHAGRHQLICTDHIQKR